MLSGRSFNLQCESRYLYGYDVYARCAQCSGMKLMEADPSRLKHRNSFNIAAMSFEPGQIAAEIRKHLPDFKMDYQIDPQNKLTR